MKNILVVDDDFGFVSFLHRRLEVEGYHVDGESGAEAALKRMRAKRPDLVVADVMMPGMDGFSFVREIRTDNGLKNTPIIIVTAHEELGEIFKVEGAQGVFSKPLATDKFVEKIRTLIG